MALVNDEQIDLRARRSSRMFKNMTAKIAALPMIATALVIFVGCTLWTIYHSFTRSRLLPAPEKWVGLKNYDRLWGENRWLISIENLAIFGACSLVLSLVIGFTLAALLDRKIRFENTIRTIILYPFALSFVVTGLVWQWLLNPSLGLQNVIREWGWTTFTFDPLNNAEIVIFGILIAGVWQGSGFVMVLMLAGMRGIDEDVWKASRVEGIPAWKTYIFIVIPMMRPVFVTALVIISAGIIKVYDLVVAQTSGGPGIASEVPAKYVIDKMFGSQNLGLGFAASTMMLLSVLVVLIPWAYLEFGGKKND
ncbi:MAG: sugar ABC transporter permease [Planktomarina sp.]|nr:sugar ABC transporter permease [Planktomarina sp.]MDT2017434.1 sugar ABC transporter permease [Planktomarina sp.]